MDPPPDRSRRCPRLPEELWAMISVHANLEFNKKLRLTYKTLCRIATPKCFKTVQFELRERSIDRLAQIASKEELGRHVQSLVLRRDYVLPKFDGFDQWMPNVQLHPPDAEKYNKYHQELEEEDISAKASATAAGFYSDGPMSDDAWMALSETAKRQMFERYETDRTEAPRLLHHLKHRTLGCRHPTGPVHSSWGDTSSSTLTLCARLEDSLERLSKLKHFEHACPMHARPVYWRGLRWGFEVYHMCRSGQDVDDDALQLSVSLRSLGWANSLNRSLRSIHLFTTGPAFWGEENLRHLWCSSAGMDIDDPSNSRYVRHMVLIEHTFVHLTSINLHVRMAIGEAPLVLPHIANCLRLMKNVEKACLVALVFGRYHEHDAQDRGLLGRLQLVRWPKIRGLELRVTTTEKSLIGLLSRLTPSLHRVCLSDGWNRSKTLTGILDPKTLSAKVRCVSEDQYSNSIAGNIERLAAATASAHYRAAGLPSPHHSYTMIFRRAKDMPPRHPSNDAEHSYCNNSSNKEPSTTER